MFKYKINFSDVDVICGAKEQINIDHLNLIASGNNDYFLKITYKNQDSKHVFTYFYESDLHTVSGVSGFYAYEFIANVIEFSINHGLNLNNIICDKKLISAAPNGIKLIYVPVDNQKAIGPKKFALNMLSVLKISDKELIKAIKKADDNNVIGILRNVGRPTPQYPQQGGFSNAETTVLNAQMPQAFADTGETTILSTDNPQPAYYGNEGETTILSTDNPQPAYYGNEGETTILSTDNPQPAYYGNEGETTILSTDNPQPPFYPVADHNGLDGCGYGETTVLSQQPSDFIPDFGNPPSQEFDTGETTVLNHQNYYPLEVPQDVVYSQYTEEHTSDRYSDAETTLFSQAPQAGVNPVFSAGGTDYKLFLIRNSNSQVINVTGNYFTIGKDAANVDAVITNNSVSRHHATITFESGSYYIMDNKSTNGTTVEGIRLQPYEKAQLFDNSIISLGTEIITVKMERG